MNIGDLNKFMFTRLHTLCIQVQKNFFNWYWKKSKQFVIFCQPYDHLSNEEIFLKNSNSNETLKYSTSTRRRNEVAIYISYDQRRVQQRSVLTIISNKVPKLRKFSIDEETWTEAAAICCFLQLAGSLTKNQSGSSYATLSVSIRTYRSILTECTRVIDASDTVLKLNSEAIYLKIRKYQHVICSDIAQLALVLDPPFGNDLLQNENVLCRHVSVVGSDGEFSEKSLVPQRLRHQRGVFFKNYSMRTVCKVVSKMK